MKIALRPARRWSVARLRFAALTAVGLSAGAARATDYIWTNNSGNGNNNWNAATNWTGGKPANSASTVLIFGDLTAGSSTTPYTTNHNNNNAVPSPGPITVNQMRFTNTASTYTVSANTGFSVAFAGTANGIFLTGAGNATFNTTIPLAVSAGTTFSTTGGGNLTVNGVVSGTGGLTLVSTGGGVIALGGANTYTGGTTLGGGTIQVSSDGPTGGSLGDAAGAVALTAGTLRFAAAGGITLVSTRTITLGGGGFGTNGGNDTVASLLTGTGDLLKTGAGILTITNAANNYAGLTRVQTGTLLLGGAGVLPTGTTVALGGATTNGTLDLAGTAPTVAGLTLDAAVPAASAANQFVGNSSATANGTLTVNGTGATTFGGTILDAVNGGTRTTALAVTGGSLTLTGANVYTGGTTVGAVGTLVVGNGAAAGSIVGDVSNAGTLTFNRGDAAGAGYTFAGTITGNGTVNKQGAGVVTLGGTANAIASVNVSAGTLRVRPGGTSAATAVTVADGAGFGVYAPGANPAGVKTLALGTGTALSFDFAGAPAASASTTTGFVPFVAVGQADGFTAAGPVTLNLSNSGGPLGGTYTLIKYTGAAPAVSFTVGTQPARASVTPVLSTPGEINVTVSQFSIRWTGGDATNPTVWDVGTIDGAAAPVTGAANWQQVGGGNPTTAYTQSGTNPGDSVVFDGAAAGSVNLSAALSPGSVTVGGGAYTFAGPGNLAGAGAVTVSGSTTTLTLATGGANAFTGGTTIKDGATLQVGDGAATSNLPGDVTFVGGGTLKFNPVATATLTVAGNVTGPGAVQATTGTTVLTGTANAYTGGTVIASGATLQVGNGTASGSLPTASLTSAGTLAFNPGTTGFTFAGDLTGGAVSVLGTNTTFFTGTGNTYTGGTTVAAGSTLQVGNGVVNGSLPGDVANAGTVAFKPAAPFAYGGAITGGAVRVLSGTLVLTGASTATVTVLPGTTLQLGDGTTASTFAGNVTANAGGTVEFRAPAGGQSYGGAAAVKVGGAGDVKFSGGATTLTAANTYTGTTTVNPGATLRVAVTAPFGTGAGVSPAVVNGTLDLNDAGVATGLTVSVGSLSGSGSIVLGTNPLTVLAVTGTANTTFGGVISGAGGFQRITSGATITLTGQNTYLGGTDIRNGTGVIKLGGPLPNVLPVTTTLLNGGNNNSTLDLNGVTQEIAGFGGSQGLPRVIDSSTGAASTFTVRLASGTTGVDWTLGATGGANFNLTKAGAGTLLLKKASGYAGATTVAGGTLQYAVAGGIPANSPVALTGGTLSTAGGTAGAGVASGTLGTLTVNGAGSALTLGTGSHALTFTSPVYTSGGLTVYGWSGTAGTSGAAGQVLFTTLDVVSNGGDVNATYAPFLAATTFDGFGPAAFVANGSGYELVPAAAAVPEPATAVGLAAVGLGLAGWVRRRVGIVRIMR